MSFRNGDTIGDYMVLARLGAGGMGEVYKVRNTISDRTEALKVLLPDLQAAPELAERFLREIKVQASLQHPNIAALHTALRIDNQLFMLLEYVEGQTLRELLDSGPIELQDAIDYVCQVLGALDCAHQHGVIHRDIKPSNIMVTPSRVAKLMDFGIASTADDRRLTRSGAAVGSLYYMSPEQVAAKTVDARSDIYSLGVTLYQMVTNRLPIDGENEYAIMNGHLREKPVPPSHHCPWLPPALSDVIVRSLEKDPAERFQTAAEFRAALGAPVTPAAPALPRPSRLSSSTPPRGSTPPAGVTATTHTPDAAQLETVKKQLAGFIGPIAGVLVTRAARKAQSLSELYDLLAREIADPRDATKFLRSRPQS